MFKKCAKKKHKKKNIERKSVEKKQKEKRAKKIEYNAQKKKKNLKSLSTFYYVTKM